MGFLAVYLSDQLVEGLTTGAAIQVFTSQMSKLFGIPNLPSASGVFGVIGVSKQMLTSHCHVC